MRSLLELLLLVAMIMLAPAIGWAQTSPRAAEHDGFGRMVFDWDGPVRWSADVAGTDLVLRFEKPVAGDPKILTRPLARYLRSVTVSPDGRMVTFGLAMPVQVKSFVTGNSTVVDLSPAAAASQQPPAQLPPPQAPPQPAIKPVPAAAPASVNVRGGEHTGFNRIVFDWPSPVNYAVNEVDGRAVISFERPARINTTSLEASLPSDVRLVEIRPHGAGTAIVLALPNGMRVRHFISGPRVAVDLVRPAGAAPPPRAAGAPLPPLAPAPGTVEQPPAQAAIPPAAGTPTLPKEDIAKILPGVKPELDVKAAPAQPRRVASLGVPFDQPTAAAVFRRAGWLWLVFDRRVEVDVALLRRSGGDLVRHVEQLDDVRGGTAIRMITLPGFNPSVRKEGLLWVFDLTEQSLAPKISLAIDRQFDFDDRGRLLVSVSEGPSRPIVLRDPEVGDLVHVVPIMPVAAGIRSPISLPAVDLPATAQGVVVIPKADAVRLETSRGGVDISMPGGLFMSRETAQTAEKGEADPIKTSSGPLDLTRWMRGGLDKFHDEHEKLMHRFIRVKPEERNTQRLEIARHYLANSMAAEALGVLKIMALTDPTMVERPEFLAVRGAANFLMARDADAIADLSAPVLGTDPQVGLWLAAAKARLEGQPARQALMLRLAPEEIKGLSPRIRVSLGRIAVQSVTGAGDAKAATRIIEAINGPGLSRHDGGTIAYLQGLASEAGKGYEIAEAKYREAEAGDSRPDRAFAGRRRIEMQLAQGTMSPAEAIPQLERLRFAWRAGDYEYDLLKRLGELMISGGQYGNGLRMLRSIVDNFADHPDVGTVQQLMSDAFARLFLEGGADKLSPITAIGLYDEFQELTPPGQRGDEMIRKLADRLAAVDLLERSADLLRHQVRFRLQGGERARVGARLAFLELSDRKPALALQALDVSEMADLPEELHNQRRYMRIRALSDLGRSAEALALLLNDYSETASGLRAEIFWGMKKWAEAATAIQSSLDPEPAGKKLTPAETRRVLDLATALTLARDDRALLGLRRTYGPLMAGTEYREAFELLTSEPERGIPDYRRIGDKIKQAEDFRTFMGEWRKRVGAEGLSAIN